MKTKSTSQTPRKFTKKNALLLIVTAVMLCASPAVALADPCPNKFSTAWTYHGTGDWFTSSNWSNGVPVCTDAVSYDAQIDNGYTAQINAGSASACQAALGVNPTDSGTLSVNGSGSNLTTCSGTLVGYQGKGNLSITNGGVVTTHGVASIAWGRLQRRVQTAQQQWMVQTQHGQWSSSLISAAPQTLQAELAY
jgi:T5SS/PEP-CTERM-associated repeat protein